MLLDPGARAAVLNVAVPLCNVAVSRLPPFFLSVKVTDPVGVLPAALTLAVKVTHESRVIDADDELNFVLVVIFACGVGLATAVAAGAMRPAPAMRLEPTKIRPITRIMSRLPNSIGTVDISVRQPAH